MLSLAFAAPLALAQVPGVPAIPRPPGRGYGEVSGIVLSDATGKPLRRAEVILTPLDANVPPRLIATDQTGKFTFAMVRAGRYTFSVQRDGYLSLGGKSSDSGARRPEEFAVTGNVTLGSFVFRMHPAGVIAGHIKYGSDAEPAVRAVVELYREFRLRGHHGFQPVSRAITDDLGEYRIHDLPPGSYYVSATRQRPPEAANAIQEPRRDARGRPLPDEAWAVTFYPGGQKLVEAVPVKIAYGTEASDIDVFLDSVPSTRISGRVTSALGGEPQSISVVVHRADARDGAAIRAAYDVSISKRGGFFEIAGVTPGPYVITVDAEDGGHRITARKFLGVSETQIDNLEILAGPPLVRRGTVRFVNANRLPPGNVRIALEPRDESAGVTSAYSDRDGAFRVILQPDVTYDAWVTGLPDGAYVESIRFGDSDVLRNGLTPLGENTRDSLDIVLGADSGEVTGNVVDRTGKPSGDAKVTLIPDPADGRLLQFVSGAVAGDGSFDLSGVAPGRYLIFATPGDPPCDIYDDVGLADCRRIAQPIDVAPSGEALIALQLP